jgi:hypothetical protein
MKLNRDHGLAFCLSMMFFRRPVSHPRSKAGRARSKVGTFEIVEVLVVGVATRQRTRQRTRQVFQGASPAVDFTLFKVEERNA